MVDKDIPRIVAEIGCNHKGDMDIVREMILVLGTFCKVDSVKFQKRNPRELLSREQYNAPHPNPMHAYGATYGEHREFLELSTDEHRIAKEWCEEMGLTYSSSVWDLTSAAQIVSLEPEFIKIPSACNLNFPLLELICDRYAGEIHISFGMTTREEEQRIIEFLERRQRAKDTVVYSCTSGYPVDFGDICLLEIDRLRSLYTSTVKDFGFSGHHLGIAADIAAMTLGAQWIERHFTLDRTWKGTDHAASLEPDGMRRLVRDVRNVSAALGSKDADILAVEVPQREKLKWHGVEDVAPSSPE